MRRLRPVLPALLVAALAVLVALPSIGFDFVYDDHAVILERQPLWEEGLGRFLTTRHWGTGRHATLASLDLDRFWGNGSAASFHATNVMLSAVVSVLVLLLARRIGLGRAGATAAAAVFAVHPTHADAVASLVGRAELLAALGVLVAMLAALRPAVADGGREVPPLRTMLVAGAGAFLAFHSKESALCLPALLTLAWLAFPQRTALVPALAGTALAAAAWAPHVLPLAGEVKRAEFVDNPLAYEPLFTRIPKALAVLADYARLSVWPHPLLPDRSFAQTFPSLTAGIAATAGWVLTGAWLLMRRRHRPRLFFAAGWFLVAFAVTANVAFPTGTIMAERLLFLPSLGACLLFGVVVDRIASRPAHGTWAAAGATAVAVALLFPAFRARAGVWESEAVYFPASAAASPRSAKAQYDLAMWLARERRQDESLAAFERALAIHPAFARANFYLAERRAIAGDVPAAIGLYERYLKEVPEDQGALTNITRLLLDAGRTDEAVTYARRLVALAPESSSARNTLVTAENAARRRRVSP